MRCPAGDNLAVVRAPDASSAGDVLVEQTDPWSRGVRLVGPTREREGELGIPVTLGTLVVRPGDQVRADDDGVVAVPAERLASPRRRGRRRRSSGDSRS